MLAKMKESGISHYMPLYIGVLCSWTTLGLLVGMNACIYEMLKLGYLFMSKSPDLWCLSRDLVCKFFAPLTVLIPNCIYRCDIIYPLVRYHGRSWRSPGPPSGPLGGPAEHSSCVRHSSPDWNHLICPIEGAVCS